MLPPPPVPLAINRRQTRVQGLCSDHYPDLNMSALARACSVSPSHINNVLLGRRRPSKDLAKRLAKLTRMPIENLYVGRE